MRNPYPYANQWQAPGQPYLPGYSPKPAYGSSTLVTIAGVVLLVLGALLTLGGAAMALVAAAGSAFIETLDPTWAEIGSAAATILAVMALLILAIGVFEMITAVGLFIHKSWARWAGIVISVIGILLGLLLVVTAYEPPADPGFGAFALAFTAAHAFTAAALGAGGEHFVRGYVRR